VHRLTPFYSKVYVPCRVLSKYSSGKGETGKKSGKSEKSYKNFFNADDDTINLTWDRAAYQVDPFSASRE
jgi:hypothetical protein